MFLGACVLFAVTVQSLHSTNGASTNKNYEDLPIKYPGPIKEGPTDRHGSMEDIPDECKGKNYCTVKPPNYPQERFNSMFKGYKGPKQPSITALKPDINNRQGDPADKDNCESSVTYEPLYKVRSKRGNWHTVVQAPEHDYVQKVRLEECTNPGAACFTIFPHMDDYSIFCKQKFIEWDILVDDGNNGTEPINTELPVCCSCHYKAVGTESRSGKP